MTTETQEATKFVVLEWRDDADMSGIHIEIGDVSPAMLAMAAWHLQRLANQFQSAIEASAKPDVAERGSGIVPFASIPEKIRKRKGN